MLFLHFLSPLYPANFYGENIILFKIKIMNVKVLYFVKNSSYNCENQEAHQMKHMESKTDLL